jgi:hypothetical protein
VPQSRVNTWRTATACGGLARMQIGLEPIVSRRIGSRYRMRLTGGKNREAPAVSKGDEEWGKRSEGGQ